MKTDEIITEGWTRNISLLTDISNMDGRAIDVMEFLITLHSVEFFRDNLLDLAETKEERSQVFNRAAKEIDAAVKRFCDKMKSLQRPQIVSASGLVPIDNTGVGN